MSDAVKNIVDYINEKGLSKSDYNELIDNLIEKDPEFTDLLDLLIDKASTRVPELANLRPQAKIMRVLKIIALMQYEVVDKGIEELKKQMFVQTAEAEWLDLHGEGNNIERKIMIKATGTVFVGSKTKPDTVYTLPESFIVGTKGSADQESLKFKVLKSVTIDSSYKANDKKEYLEKVEIEAEKGGERYNVLENSITEIFTKHNYFDLVKQLTPTSGGVDRERDDDFRQRIITKASGKLEGSIGWFKSQAEKFGGVKNAHIVPKIYGVGTVGIAIKGVKDFVSPVLINEIQAYFDSDEARPIANWKAFVFPVNKSYITIDITVYHRAENTIDKKIIHDAIQSYFKDLDVGESFIKEKLEGYIIRIKNVVNLKTNSIKHDNKEIKVVKVKPGIVFAYDESDSRITFKETDL